MAARRSKSQARRNQTNGVPGWAWLVAGLLLGIALILLAPRFLKSEGGDGFFRPKPNPDAQPATRADSEADEAIVPEHSGGDAATAVVDKPKEPSYDFYTLLPGDEVALSDAELAASAQAEAERARQAAATRETPDDAADLATPSPASTENGTRPS